MKPYVTAIVFLIFLAGALYATGILARLELADILLSALVVGAAGLSWRAARRYFGRLGRRE